jgi:formylglycine-generating enzyme required for sulfatase activity
VGPDRETVFWQSIQGGTNAAELEAYLQQFPNGTYAPLARARLTQLKGPQTAALPPATAPAPAPAPAQPAPPPVVAPAPAVPPAPVAAPASPITVPPSTEPAAGAYVASIAANVREQASTQSPVVGRLAAGQSVQVAGKSNGWYLVQQDGKPLGYVAANLLEDEAAWRQRQGTPPPQQQAAVAAPAPPAPASPAQPAVGLYLDRPGQVFRDCAECPEMVVIPGGTFMMGSPNSETGRYGDEGPVHRVTVPSFAAGKYEVTRGEFGAFARATNFRPSGGCYQWTGQKFDLDSGKSWSNPGFAQTDRDPVVCVNWDDTQRYIAWLREKSGKPYRLLSEAEWVYAARAGTTSAQVWGDRVQDACGLANLADAAARRTGPANWTYLACNDGFANTAPVGSFKPNAFGLHDMIGNAWEWVADCLNERYDGAPTDGRVWQAGDCTKHMLRGASWFFQPRVERFAARGWAEADSRDYFQGFRVARPN